MSVRNKIIAILDVVLRVPPVFMLDSIFMNGFKELSRHMYLGDNDAGGDEDYENSLDPIGIPGSIPAANFTSYSRENLSSNLFASNDTTGNLTSVSNDIYLWRQFLTFIVYVIAFFLSIIVFLLPTKSLFSVYLWMSSILLVIWSYISNEYYVQYVSQLNRSSLPDELFSMEASSLQVWRRLLQNYFLQIFLSMAFCYLSSNLYRSKIFLSKRVVAVFFVIPTIISWLPGSLPSSTKSWVNLLLSEHVLGTNDALYRRIRSLAVAFSPLVSLIVGLLYILINLLADSKTIIRELYQDYEWSKTIVRHYGTYTLIENQWVRLHVPQVLRVFWLTRLVEHAVHLISESEASWAFFEYGSLKLPSDLSVISNAAKTLIVKGCETIIAVLGMTSILSSISHQIGCGIQWFLAIEDPEDRNIGTVSALLFFILALQTGITGMEPEKRFQRLYRNLCLLFTAILHFIHNMVNPLLNSLSASRNMSIQRHARALTVCLFLITFPAIFLIYLWKNETSVTTWLLAVSAFSVEVVIKVCRHSSVFIVFLILNCIVISLQVIISLMIYVLFMIDAFRTTLWEPLDDYVYYIKATGSTIEFIFGIFLFCNGAYILLFESGGTIRALMMCIHAYFNIWLQAKQGKSCHREITF